MFRPVLKVLALLDAGVRKRFFWLVVARACAQSLDLLGLALIGLVGAILAVGFESGSSITFLGVAFNSPSAETALLLISITVALFVAKSAISSFLVMATTRLLSKAEASTAEKLSRIVFSGDLENARRFSDGEIAWIVLPGANVAISVLLFSASTLITEGILLIAVFCLFLLLDVSTSLLLAGYLAFISIVFQLLVSRVIKRLGKRLASNAVSTNEEILGISGALREISVGEKLDFFVGRLMQTRRQYAFDWGFQRFIMFLPRYFIEASLMIGFLLLVLWQFSKGSIEDGVVVLTVFISGGLRLMASLLPLQNALSDVRTRGPESAKVLKVLEDAEANSSSRDQDFPRSEMRPRGPLSGELIAVSYRYEKAKKAIENVSMKIAPGEFVAIVGPSGSGKTTVADLLLGLLVPESGEVTIDGHPPRKVRRDNPGSISYVPQRPGMVAGSIAQNVALGVSPSDIDREEVSRALSQAGLSDFVQGLPDGVNTELGKTRSSFSGGQLQRLGIARALYTRPGLLVLDEATSALDAETEDSVAREIQSLSKETTVVVIAHRLSTVQHADKVFVLEDGSVKASGTFRQVRRKVPFLERYIGLMTVKP